MSQIIKVNSKNIGMLIRFDDIAENMNWEIMNKIEIILDKFSIKPVIGVIPNNQDKTLLSFPKNEKFWSNVREWEKKGWEIAMHGYNHLYEKESFKKDYFKYGGSSEFWGQPLDIQKKKIKKGLEKFHNEKISIRVFFAPNHSYDENTFKALKECGIKEVIDGYGLFPYTEKGIKFIPQLFYKIILLPYGVQSTQIHINDWGSVELNNFEKFISKNKDRIIDNNEALNPEKNKIFNSFIRFFIKTLLFLTRKFI